MKNYLLTCLAALLLSQSAWALSLDDAKSQGLVGERSNGYLGIVTARPNNAIKLLVDNINKKRRSAYRGKADKAGVDIRVIELRVGERLNQRALPGHYIQNRQGQWVQK